MLQEYVQRLIDLDAAVDSVVRSLGECVIFTPLFVGRSVLPDCRIGVFLFQEWPHAPATWGGGEGGASSSVIVPGGADVGRVYSTGLRGTGRPPT